MKRAMRIAVAVVIDLRTSEDEDRFAVMAAPVDHRVVSKRRFGLSFGHGLFVLLVLFKVEKFIVLKLFAVTHATRGRVCLGLDHAIINVAVAVAGLATIGAKVHGSFPRILFQQFRDTFGCFAQYRLVVPTIGKTARLRNIDSSPV